MKSSITKAFRKQLRKLPVAIQKQAVTAYKQWQKNPYHNSLQFKKVSQKQPIYSARVTINYRVLGLIESDRIYWFWIGTHDEYDELLKRL